MKSICRYELKLLFLYDTSIKSHLMVVGLCAALVTVRHLLQRYKKCCNLLENEDSGGVAGNLAVCAHQNSDAWSTLTCCSGLTCYVFSCNRFSKERGLIQI